MEQNRIRQLKDYLRELDIKPRNLELYDQAFLHRSYAYEQGLPAHATNERLEFLGDSVLGLALADYLCKRHPTSDEGDISKMKAQLGSRQTLAEVSRRLGLTDYLRLGRGEAKAGTQNLPSLMANVFEAVVGALYLDHGYVEAADFVVRNFAEEFEKDLVSTDFKSLLQEFAQRRFHSAPYYQITRAYGPEHHKTFELMVRLNGRVYGRGRGHTKKEAEQSAAKQAMRRFNAVPREQREPAGYRSGGMPHPEPAVRRRRWFWPFGG